jgi:hypothetical protein
MGTELDFNGVSPHKMALKDDTCYGLKSLRNGYWSSWDALLMGQTSPMMIIYENHYLKNMLEVDDEICGKWKILNFFRPW